MTMIVFICAVCLLVGLIFAWLPRRIVTDLLIGLAAYIGTVSMLNAGYSSVAIAAAAAVTLSGIGISCGARIYLAVKRRTKS